MVWHNWAVRWGLAVAATALAMGAAWALHSGMLAGGDALVDWILSRWTGSEIASFMDYAAPLALGLLIVSLLLTAISAKPRQR